jgi:hypothetical protein
VILLLGVLVLFVLLFGGGRLLGCAWHLFVAGAVLILVIAVVLAVVAGRAGMNLGIPSNLVLPGH